MSGPHRGGGGFFRLTLYTVLVESLNPAQSINQFWVVFSFCNVCIFNLSSVLYFPEHPTWMVLYSLIVLI